MLSVTKVMLLFFGLTFSLVLGQSSSSSTGGVNTASLCPAADLSVLPYYDPKTILDLQCSASTNKCIGLLCMCLDDELPQTTNCSSIRVPVKCSTATDCISSYMRCIESAAAAEGARAAPSLSPSSTGSSAGGTDSSEKPGNSLATSSSAGENAPFPFDRSPLAGDLCVQWGQNLTSVISARPPRPMDRKWNTSPLFLSCQQSTCQLLEAVVFRSILQPRDTSSATGGAGFAKELTSCVASEDISDAGKISVPELLQTIASWVCPMTVMNYGGGIVERGTPPPPPPPTTTTTTTDKGTGSGLPSGGSLDLGTCPIMSSDQTMSLNDLFPTDDVLEKCPVFSKCARACFELFAKSDPSVGPSDDQCLWYAEDCLRAAATCVTSLSTVPIINSGGAAAADGEVVMDQCQAWDYNLTQLFAKARADPATYAAVAFTTCVGVSCSVLNYVSSGKCKPNATSWTDECFAVTEKVPPPTYYYPGGNGGGTKYPNGNGGGTNNGGGNAGPGNTPATDDPNAGFHPSGSGGGNATNNGAGAAGNGNADLSAPCPTYGGVTFYNVQQLFGLGCPKVTSCLSDLCSCVGASGLGATSCTFPSSPARSLDCSMSSGCLQKGYSCIRQAALLANASSGPVCSTWGNALSGAIVSASSSKSTAYTLSDVFGSCRHDACTMLQSFVQSSGGNSTACNATAMSYANVCSNTSGIRVQSNSLPLPIRVNAAVVQIAYKMSFPGSFDQVLSASPSSLSSLMKAFEQGLTTFIGVTVVVDKLEKGSLIVSFHSLTATSDTATASVIVQNAAALTTTADVSWMAGANSIVLSLGGPALQSPVVSSAVVSTIQNGGPPSQSSAAHISLQVAWLALAVIASLLMILW